MSMPRDDAPVVPRKKPRENGFPCRTPDTRPRTGGRLPNETLGIRCFLPAALTHRVESVLLRAMVGIDRDQDHLIVSEGPSDLHKVGTWCGLAFALMVGVALIARPAGTAWQALGIVLASVPLLVLLRSWITREHRFDRAAGLLIVG